MDYKKYNDNELIYMVQENGESYSDLLLKKYHPIILKISNEYYLKSFGCGYELDDFYQEALVSFYRSLHTYNGSKDTLFYTYTIVCIRRALMSFSRRIYNIRNKSLDADSVDISELDYLIEDINENPKYKDSYKGLECIIKDVIFNLPLEAGAILELKMNGFTYKEIGKLLGIPMSSVEFRSRRARRILRNRVKAYYCK